MKGSGVVFWSFGIAFLVSFATGVLSTNPTTLAGATGYGFPFVWLFNMALLPQYNPWHYNAGALIGDTAFWLFVIVLLFSATRIKDMKH